MDIKLEIIKTSIRLHSLKLIEGLDDIFMGRFDCGLIGHGIYTWAEASTEPVSREYVMLLINDCAIICKDRWLEARHEVLVFSIVEGYMEQWKKGVNTTSPSLAD